MWITWSDPDDTAMSKWAGTKIVYKEGSYPEDENDGTLAVNNITRDAYSTAETALKIEGLENDKEYFVRAFPYGQNGIIGFHPNNNSRAKVTYSIGYVFGQPSSPAYAFGIVCVIPDISKIVENGIAYADEIDGINLKLCFNEYYYNADGSLDRWYQDREFYGPNENNDLMCYVINGLYDQTDHFGIKVTLYDTLKKIRLISNNEILIDKANDSLVSPMIINSSSVLENGGISFNYMPSVPSILTINGRTILNGRYYIKLVRVNDGTETTVYTGLVSEETYTAFDYNFPSAYTGYIYLYPLAEVPANGSSIFVYSLKMLKSNIVPIIQFDWETATWEQVCQFLDIAKENNYDLNDYFSVGMEKEIDYMWFSSALSGSHILKIIGINMDGDYTLTLSGQELLSQSQYNILNGATENYSGSLLHQAYTELENAFQVVSPSYMKNHVKTVNKKNYTGKKDLSVSASEISCKIFPLAGKEVGFNYNFEELQVYPYFVDNNTRIKSLSGTNTPYWTRSMNNTYTNSVLRGYVISATGGSALRDETGVAYMPLNFVLGALDEEGGT